MFRIIRFSLLHMYSKTNINVNKIIITIYNVNINDFQLYRMSNRIQSRNILLIYYSRKKKI